MELSFSSQFEISFETPEGSVAATKGTEEDFQCLSGITAASIVLTTESLYTSNTISLISFLSKRDETKILKHFLVRLEFSRETFVSGRKKARYAGFCVFWILRGRSYFSSSHLFPVKNHGTCVSIYVDEYQAETTVVVAAATLPGQTTGPVNTKESPGIFFVFFCFVLLPLPAQDRRVVVERERVTLTILKLAATISRQKGERSNREKRQKRRRRYIRPFRQSRCHGCRGMRTYGQLVF